jgi:hypothetical protein
MVAGKRTVTVVPDDPDAVATEPPNSDFGASSKVLRSSSKIFRPTLTRPTEIGTERRSGQLGASWVLTR